MGNACSNADGGLFPGVAVFSAQGAQHAVLPYCQVDVQGLVAQSGGHLVVLVPAGAAAHAVALPDFQGIEVGLALHGHVLADLFQAQRSQFVRNTVQIGTVDGLHQMAHSTGLTLLTRRGDVSGFLQRIRPQPKLASVGIYIGRRREEHFVPGGIRTSLQ